MIEQLTAEDPAIRLAAAQALARLQDVPAEAIQALMGHQHDEDRRFGDACVAALDRIQPPSRVAVRVDPRSGINEVVQVCVQPAYTGWFRVECGDLDLAPGEKQGECWQLVAHPPHLGAARPARRRVAGLLAPPSGCASGGSGVPPTGPDDPIVVGDRSRSALLRKLSDR